ERRDDIPSLAHHFAERAAVRFGLPPADPTGDDIKVLQAYAWPGNIRELAAVLDRAAILGDGKGLEIAKALGLSTDLPLQFEHKMNANPASVTTSPEGDQRIATLDEAMKAHIELALRETGGRIEGRRGTAAV